MVGQQVNKTIYSFEEALTELKDPIQQITLDYRKDYREDVSQACWVEALTQLSQGPKDLLLLVYRMRRAGQLEVKNLRQCMLPARSVYPPPKRVSTKWVHGEPYENSKWEEPSYKQHEANHSDFLSYLLGLTQTDNQYQVVLEFADAVDLQAWDAKYVVSDRTIAWEMGLPTSSVQATRTQLHKLYKRDLNK
jgi:hypothetical protein